MVIKKVIILITLICILITGSNCSKDNEQRSSGLTISLTKLFEIDPEIPEREDVYLGPVPWDIDLDENNNLYFIDSYNPFIKVFDSNGKYIRSFGDKGQGPGELERPVKLNITKNNIFIEQSNYLVKVWDRNGKWKRQFRFDPGMQKFLVRDDFFLCIRSYGNFPDWKILKSDLSGSKIDTVYSIIYDKKRYPIHAPAELIALNSNNEFFVAPDFDKYLIEKYDITGNLVQKIEKDYERKPYSKEAELIISNMLRNSVVDPERKVPEYPPVVRSVIVDDLDNIWVITGESHMDMLFSKSVVSRVDIYNKNGTYISSIEVEDVGKFTSIKNGRLITISGTKYGGQMMTVVVYEINYN